MKPNFALNLTQEAIVLLHRTARGWLAIGEASLDSDDLSEALGYLRASAFGLSPQGVTTKLIVPNSQILYLEVDAPGPDAPARRIQILKALEGRTPYAVDDLVFDIWGDGPRVQVAVVARETLDEAEAFIDQHRFNPVSFVAIPPAVGFGGEPFFGQTKAAARLLAAGETVSRDQDPVNIVTRDGPREDAGARTVKETPAKNVENDKPEKPAAAPEVPGADIAAPAAAPSAKSQASSKVSSPPKPEPAAALPPVSTPRTDAPVMAPAIPTPAAVPDTVPRTQDKPAAAPPVEPPPSPPLAASELPAPMPKAKPPVGTAQDVAPPPPAPPTTAAPIPARVVPADEPALSAPPRSVPQAPAVPSFTSRRREEPVPASADIPPPPPLAPRLTAASTAGAAAPPVAPAPPRSPAQFTAAPPAAPPVAPTAPPAIPAPPRQTAPSVTPPAPVAIPVALPPQTASKTAVLPPAAAVPSRLATPSGLAFPAPQTEPAARPAPAAPTPVAASVPFTPPVAAAASRLRVGSAKTTAAARPVAQKPGRTNDGSLRPGAAAGAMAKGAIRPRGKPRFLGLALTGALLIFLMVVAAYSSLYLSRDDTTTAPETDVAAVRATDSQVQPAAPAPVIVSAGDPVEPDPEMLADLAEAEAAPEPDIVPQAAAPVTEPLPAATEPTPPEPPAIAEAPPPAAVSGDTQVGLSTASAAFGQDEIFLSAADAPPPAFDAVALPAPVASPDAAPETTAPPPPFGTVYQFDDQGRIAAGATGVVVPGGFWLIAARPPVVPPVRAAAPATEPAVEAAVAPAPAPDADGAAPIATQPDDSAFAADATITPRRPQARPASLTPPPAAAPEAAAPLQTDDDASLPRDDPRHAALRPRARSPAILARAAEAALARQAADESQILASASLVATAEAQPATPVALQRPANASLLAVPLSRRPAARPLDFSRAVAAAAAEATQPKPRAEPEPEPEDMAASPEAEPEPEVVASAAPRIPTRANVAKQATFANAINLSKVNLIGIYGTPSTRYAMVRTSGGRFTRVKVGDRVDGGTVAAITASEVRYKKGGRMLTLAMPRG